ncbi:MAG: glucosamine inositolphosphorylceramide transferase family protein [Armatimonadota bacterium]
MTLSRMKHIYRKHFKTDQWNIGIVDHPIHTFLSPDFIPDIRWLPTPKNGTFHADPFGMVKDDHTFIFMEEYDYQQWKGKISVIEIIDGRFSNPVPVMEMPCHMSYPYLIEHDDAIYCIPETCEIREVVLYKAVEFPYRWSTAKTLIRGIAAVDSTVFYYNNMWWMFCTDDDDNPNEKLFIWYAEDLSGPWKPHLSNPVKTDRCSARPGGTPFIHDGAIYRPSQDCTNSYGNRLIINRICELTTSTYIEERAAVAGPFSKEPYKNGTHTLSSIGSMTLIDAKREITMWPDLRASVFKNIRK